MDTITIIVAIYGAILSTLLAVKEFVFERRRIKVECTIAFIQSRIKGSEEFISITAINIGHRPVQLIMAGLLFSNKSQFTQLRNSMGIIPLPKKLEDGESVTVFLEEKEVLKTILNLKNKNKNIKYSSAYAKDAEGNIYKTALPKWFTKNNIG